MSEAQAAAQICVSEWWAEKDSNLRRRKPADLQSALVDHLSIDPRFFQNWRSAWASGKNHLAVGIPTGRLFFPSSPAQLINFEKISSDEE